MNLYLSSGNLRCHSIFSHELHNYMWTFERDSHPQVGDAAASMLSLCKHRCHPSCGTRTITEIYSCRRRSKQYTFTLEENIAVVVRMKRKWQKWTLKKGHFLSGCDIPRSWNYEQQGSCIMSLQRGKHFCMVPNQNNQKNPQTAKKTNKKRSQGVKELKWLQVKKRGVFSLPKRPGKCFWC